MAKKKKGKKAKNKQIKKMPLEQLLEKAKGFYNNNKARDAVSILKTGIKTHGLTEEIREMLFKSYLLREDQLRSKNMNTEADMVKKQALEFMPSIETISEDDMVSLVAASSAADAFKTYGKYLSVNSPSLKIEQTLANHLIKGAGPEIIEKLPGKSMIKRDAAPVPNAVSLMNQGKWEQALAALKPVPRMSPFAPMRLFCRAMTCFINNDDESALKALSMIPKHFALANVVDNLKIVLSRQTDSAKRIKAQSKTGCLWEGPPDYNSYGTLLYKALENKDFKNSRELIIKIGKILNPEDPAFVICFILEIIWNMVLHNRIEEYQFERLLQNILPKDYFELLAAKINLQGTAPRPISMAGYYITLLDREFPEPGKQKIAHAQVLLFIVDLIFKRNNISQLKKEKSGIEKYKKIMGIKSSVPELVLIEILCESINIDPLNKKAYELLVQLPRPTRAARNKVEKALSIMLKKFPDDPFPCLETATVYYENHAFRKAENILAEAMKRAPHDNRVIDRHVLALLISSDKNITRGKFHLVERDIQKAEELESKKIWPFVVAKRIILKLVNPESRVETNKHKTNLQILLFPKEHQYFINIIDEEINDLSLFEVLRLISILIPDIKDRKINYKNNIVQYLEKIFEKKLKNVSSLTSSQVINLLAPLGREFSPIVGIRTMAGMFLKHSKSILNRISDSEIIPLYDLILEPSITGYIKNDIKKRVKTAKNKRDRILLKFYLVILQHLDDEKNDSDLFYDIIDKVEGTPLESDLEAMASRMAKHASGSLKLALSKFDFEILDDMFFPPGFPGNFDDFMPPMPSFDDDDKMPGLPDLIKLLGNSGLVDSEEFEEETKEIIESVENYIDDIEVRGLPTYVIKDMRAEVIRYEPSLKQEIDTMARLIDDINGRTRLSREAQLILFGKVQKKKKK